MSAGSLAKASLVGANTVKDPPAKTLSSPVDASKLLRVEKRASVSTAWASVKLGAGLGAGGAAGIVAVGAVGIGAGVGLSSELSEQATLSPKEANTRQMAKGCETLKTIGFPLYTIVEHNSSLILVKITCTSLIEDKYEHNLFYC